jgi:hypothetical protein
MATVQRDLLRKFCKASLCANSIRLPRVCRQTKENEVGGASGTHGRGEKRVQGFGGKARWKEFT